MNVLVLHPEVERLRILAFCLESRAAVHAFQTSSLEQAMEILLGESPVHAVVVAEGDLSPKLFKYLLSTGAVIPVVLVRAIDQEGAPVAPELKIVGSVSEAEATERLPQLIAAVRERAGLGEASAKDKDFVRINVELLLKAAPLEGDVYVRLSSVKHVKIFHAGAPFTETDVHRILGVKKIDFLYVQRATAAAFVKRLGAILSGEPEPRNEHEHATLLETAMQTQETLHALAQHLGFTPEIIELTKSHMSSVIKAIGGSPRLTRALQPALSRSEGSLSSHSMTVANVACGIAAKLHWPSDSTFGKLIFAAILHDIALSNADQTKVHTRLDLSEMRKSHSAAEVGAIENHMFVAGDVANKFTEIPSDVHVIILQHHERPDGSGFPRGLTATAIAPLAAVFITAHDLVDAMEESKDQEFDFEAFWRHRYDTVGVGTFKKIAKAFLDCQATKVA